MTVTDYHSQFQKGIVIRCENMAVSSYKLLGTYRKKSVFEPMYAVHQQPAQSFCSADKIVGMCHREMTKLHLWPPCFSEMSLVMIVANLMSLQEILASFAPHRRCCNNCNLNPNSLLWRLICDMKALAKPLCLQCVKANIHYLSIGLNCGASDSKKCRLGHECHEDLMRVEYVNPRAWLKDSPESWTSRNLTEQDRPLSVMMSATNQADELISLKRS